MNEHDAPPTPDLEAIVEEVLDRHRQGERPDLSEYVRRYPTLADELAEVLPTLLMLEEFDGPPVDEQGQTSAVAPSALVDRRVADYRIVRELGRGGMGVVYEAEQVSLGRRVALKLLPHRESEDSPRLLRFEREARVAARLHHTNIVPVFEVGHDGPYTFYAMQLIEGRSLDFVIDELQHRGETDSENPNRNGVEIDPTENEDGVGGTCDVGSATAVLAGLSPGGGTESAYRQHCRWVAKLGLQAADALEYAHERGIIHRDVKPANLILDEAGTVWLTDFGLAKTEEEGLTTTGSVLGTLRYLAPERFRGECDARSDIYALGLTLYELLTFRHAFEESDQQQLLHAIANEEPARPRAVRAWIPRDLETICLHCVDKEPHRRYSSAQHLADDLRRFLAGEPIAARPLGIVERVWRRVRRSPLETGLCTAIVVALLALVGAVVAWMYQGRLQHANGQLTDANGKLQDALGQANRAKNDAIDARDSEAKAKDFLDQVLYFRQVSLALAEYNGNAIGRARQLLRECAESRRHWEWRYVNRLCHSELLTINEHGDWVNAVGYSPDGKQIASASNDKTVRIWEAATGKPIRVLRGPAKGVFDLDFSPTGEHLVSTSFDGTASVWDLATGKKLFSLERIRQGKRLLGAISSVRYRSDGLRIVGVDFRRVVEWDVKTGRVVLSFETGLHYPRKVNYSPDGQRLVTAGNDKLVKVWESATGRELLTLPGHAQTVFDSVFSADGKYIASGSFDKTARLWDSETGTLLHTLKGHSSGIVRVVFSPDGKRLVTAGQDSTVRLWDTVTGEELLVLRGHLAPVSGVAFRPDGQRIVSAGVDRTIKLWRPVSESDSLVREGFDWHFGRANTTSPDGKLRVSIVRGKAIAVWDTTTNRKIVTIGANSEPRGRVAFSPESEQLANATRDRQVRIWEARTGKHILTLRGHTGGISDVVYSPDGLVVATASIDKTVRLWHSTTGQELFAMHGHEKLIHRLAFRGDGKHLASISFDGTVRIWDVATGKAIRVLRGYRDFVTGVTYNKRGDRLATGGADRNVLLWNPVTGEILHRWKGYSGTIENLGFSEDGKRLAIESSGGIVRVVDTTTGYETLVVKE